MGETFILLWIVHALAEWIVGVYNCTAGMTDDVL